MAHPGSGEVAVPTILTRQQWGARAPKTTPTPVPISARSGYCVHYDGGNPVILRTLADVIAKIQADQNYHMDGQGWNDIGYNYLVVSAPGFPAIDGLLVEGRGRDVVGAHCMNHNTPWIGTQVTIGGTQQPSTAALVSVRAHYEQCSAAHGAALAKFGHRDGFATSCPGDTLYGWVHAGMPVGSTPPPPPPPPPVKPPVVNHNTGLATEKPWGAFPLPAGDWYGVDDHTPNSHSGARVADQRAVKQIQREVGVTADGVFGDHTAAAVGAWQSANNLTADRGVGPLTWSAMTKA
jgi:hypothetical protein